MATATKTITGDTPGYVTGLAKPEHRSRPFDPAMVARIEGIAFAELIETHNGLVKLIAGAEPDLDDAIRTRQELAVVRHEIDARRVAK